MNKNFKLKQGGFINGALIIGIALMAVVVGAIAMASSSSTTDIAAQKTKTTASVGMKKVADAVEAFQIKAAEDGVAAVEADTASFLPKTLPKGFLLASGSIATDVTYASGTLSIANVDKDVCKGINKALGLTEELAAIGTNTEACEYTATAGTYKRVLKAA